MKQRSAFRVAWSVWGLSMAALIVPFAYRFTGHAVAGLGDQPGSIAPVVTILLFIPSFATVGAILAAKRPSNPIGWLVSASGLCYALGTFSILVGHFSTRWSDWLSSWVWGIGIGIPATFVLLLFPTGTLPSRRWRPVGWFAGILLVATFLGSAFQPGVMEGSHSINPLGIGGPLGGVFRDLRGAFGLLVPAGLAAVASIVVRFRRAESLEREQIKWLMYAGALLVAGTIAGSIVPSLMSSSELGNNLQNAIISGSFVFVPLAIGIAVMRYRLYDIDIVINKTLVYAGLAGFITAVYVGIVVGLGAAIGSRQGSNLGLSIVATAVVAVAFQPVRSRVQRFANLLVYGRRATPYEVLSTFAKRIAETVAVEEHLPRLARALADGTGAASATVWLAVHDELRPEAAWPEGTSRPATPASDPPAVPGATLVVPVRHSGVLLGALSLTKIAGERLTPAQEKLANDLAAQAGLVFRNVGLTKELLERLRELQASRQRLVAAQDEERRRLERNIHDGAQQQLVAMAVKTRLARTLAQTDPGRGRSLVADLERELASALDDLRDLARGIYPSLLADRGLPAALLAQAGKASLPVTVEPDGVGRYPQDTEAAVYFCTLEALQNVAKYANASHAWVRLFERDGQLAFEVEDDGAGFDDSLATHGTGLQGMVDRMAALGGELIVRSRPGQGTTVTGRLPVQPLVAAR